MVYIIPLVVALLLILCFVVYSQIAKKEEEEGGQRKSFFRRVFSFRDAPHATSDVLTTASVRGCAGGIPSEHVAAPGARGALAAGSWQVPGW